MFNFCFAVSDLFDPFPSLLLNDSNISTQAVTKTSDRNWSHKKLIPAVAVMHLFLYIDRVRLK